MSKKLGKDAKCYYNATPVTTTPTAGDFTLLLDNITDLNTNLETGEADVSTRGSGGWRQTLSTLKDGSIEFTMMHDEADVAYQAFRDAWLNGTEIAVAAMSGLIATAGSEGLASNFTVTNFSRGEPLEEAMTVNVTIKPSSHTTWLEVGGA